MDQDPELIALLKEYPRNTACIRGRRFADDRIKNWFIGALTGRDDETALRKHLAKWFPGVEFPDGTVDRVPPETIQFEKEEVEGPHDPLWAIATWLERIASKL